MKKSILKNIENALEEIRPFLKNDGGNISLIGIEKNIVKVKFEGACSSCTLDSLGLLFLGYRLGRRGGYMDSLHDNN